MRVSEMVRVVTFKLDDELLRDLDRVADELGVTRSEVIRMALKAFIRGRSPRREVIRVRRVILT